MKRRLDHEVFVRQLTRSRSEAESWIKLGKITVNGAVVIKPGYFVDESAIITLTANERYVSRAGLKLASIAGKFAVEFTDKLVLDVGSSTGGFTDYALQHGARRVVAVDVGTDQLHESLRNDARIELYEKTDIRDVGVIDGTVRIARSDIVVIDVSFISLREILPHIAALCHTQTAVLAMLKPQFEAGKGQVTKGVIKNDAVRRTILKDFELWVRQYFVVKDKADSEVTGMKGNKERFYHLHIPSNAL